jgi:hypothetical protein
MHEIMRLSKGINTETVDGLKTKGEKNEVAK